MSSYIKINTTLGTHPVVFQIAQSLKLSRAGVVGRIVLVWAWADGLQSEGIVLRATPEIVDQLVECQGFAAQLERFGFFKFTRDGVQFPAGNFHSFNSSR